jgi:hypothetical protein
VLDFAESAEGNPRMKLALLLMVSLTALGQDKATQTTSQTMSVTLVSVQRMTVGEAYDCPSIDVQWSEAHCYAPTKQNLEAPKHKYLVKATFDKPVEADKNGWAWDFTCRLDSYKTATCHVNRPTKPE